LVSEIWVDFMVDRSFSKINIKNPPTTTPDAKIAITTSSIRKQKENQRFIIVKPDIK